MKNLSAAFLIAILSIVSAPAHAKFTCGIPWLSLAKTNGDHVFFGLDWRSGDKWTIFSGQSNCEMVSREGANGLFTLTAVHSAGCERFEGLEGMSVETLTSTQRSNSWAGSALITYRAADGSLRTANLRCREGYDGGY